MKRSDWYGLGLSLIVHVLVFLLLHSIKSEPLVPDQLGFIQVEFGSFSEGRPVQQAPDTVTEQETAQEEIEEQQEQPPPPSDPEESKPVDLPDQTIPAVDPETIESPDTDIEAIQPEEPEEQFEVEEEENENEEVRPLGSGNTAGDSGAESGDEGEGAEEEKAAPYQIEGLNRTPIMTPRPDYPEQVNVTLSVRITVNPQGEIVTRIPLRKGNPAIEQAVMEALQRWRFNPLPINVPQENQTGIITFRFRLE